MVFNQFESEILLICLDGNIICGKLSFIVRSSDFQRYLSQLLSFLVLFNVDEMLLVNRTIYYIMLMTKKGFFSYVTPFNSVGLKPPRIAVSSLRKAS